MSSPRRADLLATIAQLCQLYPEWRFGQLVANIAGWADQEIWDVEDEQLLEAARLHLKQFHPPRANGIEPDQWLKLTGAAILVSRASTSSQAAPAA
jgi:hypothetical protein